MGRHSGVCAITNVFVKPDEQRQGLPHERYMQKSSIYGDEDNGKGKEHTGIMGSGNHRAIQQYEVEDGVLRILNEISGSQTSSKEYYIKGCDYN